MKDREFGIRYISELCFVTEWVNDTQEGFDLLRANTKVIAQNYLQFLQKLDSSVKGVTIEYRDHDGDEFDQDVIKWHVTIKESVGTNTITEVLEGTYTKGKYRVVSTNTSEVILDGAYEECADYIAKLFPDLDIEKEEDVNIIIKEVQVEYYEVEYLTLR